MEVKVNGLNLSEAILQEMASDVDESKWGTLGPFLGGAAAGVGMGLYNKYETEKSLEYKLKQDPKFQEILLALQQNDPSSTLGQTALKQFNDLRIKYGLHVIEDPKDLITYVKSINQTSEDYTEEGQDDQDPTVRDLKQLLTTEKLPWQQNLTKWRIQYYLDGKHDFENPNVPLDSHGNRKPVVDSLTWIKQNPTLISRGLVPNDALPPEAQKPGVLDTLKKTVGINEDLDRIKSLKNHLLG